MYLEQSSVVCSVSSPPLGGTAQHPQGPYSLDRTMTCAQVTVISEPSHTLLPGLDSGDLGQGQVEQLLYHLLFHPHCLTSQISQ